MYMATFTKEELLKIAELSLLKLDEKEIALFAGQLKTIIEYTEELANADVSNAQEPNLPFNVFREDKVVKFEADQLLDNAPDREDQYFVMPQIITKK
ncbi:Asp-tRNA(Asn)/Glu-tRNA(Gln) amidotransferase GatCAB subunit C [Candidatus Dependentiae bacterium]|nr:MAG: Asp-tRNA(Asn)/Glu-tRNA(Gln) amidotransferase GatCAB subunit C [Candidatus Dependentiae bacterium]